MFLGAIKLELQENKDIIELFGIKRDSDGNVRFIKDSESDIIVEFTDGSRFRITSKGSEQKLRGLLWNGLRPDLLILDDLENDEIVMNRDRREKFRRWFYGALLPILSKDGLVRYVGTILHMDSMLERLMPEHQLFSRYKNQFIIREDLKEYTNHNTAWKSIKYRAHNEDFSKVLWKEKLDAKELKRIKEDYTSQGLSDVYSQEYLNMPIDDSIAFFKKGDFIPLKEEDKKLRLNYYITADLAISGKERADYTVFVIGGVDENNVLQIKNIIRDRLDGESIVNTILNLQKIYEPLAFGIEDMQITKSIGPFLREQMRAQNIFPNIVLLKPHKTDKVSRARSFQSRMRAGGVKFDKEADWYPDLEEELIKFPRARHDDQVDGVAYLGLLIDQFIEAATKEELEEDQYYEELEKSGLNLQGRNEVTGY